MTARALLKAGLETALASQLTFRIALRQRRGKTIVLAYHNVVPQGEGPVGERSLHLPVARFAEHLDLLAETHDIVELQHVTGAFTSERPAAVITFDDAYVGAMTAGVGELARRGLPATIFVSPWFVGGSDFWWDALAHPDSGAVQPRLRAHALEQLAGRDVLVRRWARECGIVEHSVPDHARCATTEQILNALRYPGISIGSHSWSHANLTALDDGLLRDELSQPRDWIRKHLGVSADWLAYPYGAFDRRVQEGAAGAGYHGALTLQAGWVGQRAVASHAFPRMNVPAGVSSNGFRLRISGILRR